MFRGFKEGPFFDLGHVLLLSATAGERLVLGFQKCLPTNRCMRNLP